MVTGVADWRGWIHGGCAAGFDKHSWFLAFEVSESGNSDACMGLEKVT
jgi:hypothetical protein